MSGLFANPEPGVLLAAIQWIVGLLTGPTGVAAAIIAVAGVGFLLLRGRMSVRHAGQVMLGCFLLFGAANLGAAMHALGRTPPAAPRPYNDAPPPFDAGPTQNAVYDPYAGAAVP